MTEHEGRVEKAGRLMEEAGIDVLLLSKPANMFYLTGDGRLCAYAIVTRGGRVALGVPSTDVGDASQSARFDKIVGFEDEVGMLHSINHFFEEFDLQEATVGLEHTFLTMSMQAMFTHPHAVPSTTSTVDATHLLSELRMLKSPTEVDLMRGAAKVAESGMAAAVEIARLGASEIEVAGEAELAMRKAGAEDFFRTYVASGPRTNIAHGLPSYRRIEEGDLVMIDLHPVCHGYSADMCRTVCVGEPGAAQQEAYDLYLSAQQETIRKVRAGVTIQELEAAIHEPLGAAGHADHVFGPPIHGVGIEFEEAPLPSGHAFFHGEAEAVPLRPGTVISVGNCGLYTGPFGVRVEDTVLVTEEGYTQLTTFARSLT
jgi:Xaa-Pro aminopeptidase